MYLPPSESQAVSPLWRDHRASVRPWWWAFGFFPVLGISRSLSVWIFPVYLWEIFLKIGLLSPHINARESGEGHCHPTPPTPDKGGRYHFFFPWRLFPLSFASSVDILSDFRVFARLAHEERYLSGVNHISPLMSKMEHLSRI